MMWKDGRELLPGRVGHNVNIQRKSGPLAGRCGADEPYRRRESFGGFTSSNYRWGGCQAGVREMRLDVQGTLRG